MSNIREIYMAFHDTKNRLHRKRVLLLRKRDSVCFLYAEKGKAVMKKTNDVSRLAGVSRRTLQYYDDEGLLITERTSDNYRLYDRQAMERIWEILVYKEMGFELKEIREILEASESEKNYYFRKLIRKLEEKIYDLRGQLKFISLIIEEGFPEKPDESSGITYTRRIAELRQEGNEKQKSQGKILINKYNEQIQ